MKVAGVKTEIPFRDNVTNKMYVYCLESLQYWFSKYFPFGEIEYR